MCVLDLVKTAAICMRRAINDMFDKIYQKRPLRLRKSLLTPDEEMDRITEINNNRNSYYFCAVCGSVQVPPHNIDHFYDKFAKCVHCGSIDTYVFSKYDRQYYKIMSEDICNTIRVNPVKFTHYTIYDTCSPEDYLFLSEIERNSLFDYKKYKDMCASISSDNADYHPRFKGVKCPICKSLCYVRLITPPEYAGGVRYVCLKCRYKSR